MKGLDIEAHNSFEKFNVLNIFSISWQTKLIVTALTDEVRLFWQIIT